LAFKLNY